MTIAKTRKQISTYDAEIKSLQSQLSQLEKQQASTPPPLIEAKAGMGAALLHSKQQRDDRAAQVGRLRESIAELQQEKGKLQIQLDTLETEEIAKKERVLARQSLDACNDIQAELTEINARLEAVALKLSERFIKYDAAYRNQISVIPGSGSAARPAPYLSKLTLVANELIKEEQPGPQRSAYRIATKQIAIPAVPPESSAPLIAPPAVTPAASPTAPKGAD